MSVFEGIKFRGTFRAYQQRILDNADKYLRDGRINIVAAPGSGKTVLGLELIRRIGKPCIILSPTTAIREQWGTRFREMFAENEAVYNEAFSSSLHSIKKITSVTYQALYSALEKAEYTEDGENCDYRDIELIEAVKAAGIGTICLDEAHHLKNEWQKALEKFTEAMGASVTIVSLTATPPYDSDPAEWARYVAVCGEIDEEIFVPELVAQGTLCPHQDYVYFNFPTAEEEKALTAHAANARAALEEIHGLTFLASVAEKLNASEDYDELYSHVKEYVALCAFLTAGGHEIKKRKAKSLTAGKALPACTYGIAETALEFLLDGELLSEEEKATTERILKKHSVYERGKVRLETTEKLKRALISSVGKLKSIGKIASSEYANIGAGLRLLILTDHIGRENLDGLTGREFNAVNAVSVFETVRRAVPEAKTGVLTGSLVILPDRVKAQGEKSRKRIAGTGYSEVEFSSSSRGAVGAVSELFERGEIEILVGTKSLLGEGWDSPKVNTLILASFVGSYVLSNQMRGRSIRPDPDDPMKCANVWHLVTVEPDYIFKDSVREKVVTYFKRDESELKSQDFEILKRRFDAFTGPDYDTGEIESGIGRITAIKPPFDKKGIERINANMLELSSERALPRAQWEREVKGRKAEVVVETLLPQEKKVPVARFFNLKLLIAEAILGESACIAAGLAVARISNPIIAVVTALALQLAVAYLVLPTFLKFLKHLNPARSFLIIGKAVCGTLAECGLIDPDAQAVTEQDKDLTQTAIYLRNASVHDQNVFNAAMKEFFSPIENPRYVIVKRNALGALSYLHSYACPSAIGRKKEYAEIFAKKLASETGNFKLIYTRNASGRKTIMRCRSNSYITLNAKAVDKKFKVSHWE